MLKVSFARANKIAGFLMVLPALALMGFIIVYPFIDMIRMSFYRYKTVTDPFFVGFGNYIWTFNNPVFWESLKNVMYFTVIIVVLTILIGLTYAIILNRDFKGKNIVRILYLTPAFLSYVVAALIFFNLYREYGMLTWIIRWFIPNPPNFLIGKFSIFYVSLLAIWSGIPFTMLYLLAAMESISKDVYEAAKIDGAFTRQIILNITLPLIKPTFAVVLMLKTIECIGLFSTVWLLTGGGPAHATETIATFAFRNGLELYHFGRASAMSVIHILVSMIPTAVYIKILWK